MKQYKKYLEAKKLNECGYHKQALQIYQSLYNDEPDNDLINYGIAHTLLAIYEDIYLYPEIEQQIRSHIKKSDILGIYELGQLEERLGNIELARRNYKKANKFNNNWLSFYGLIELERRLGNIKEAKSEYDQFKKRVRDNPDIQKHSDQYRIYLLGMCAMKLDDDPVARKIFHYLRDIPEFEKYLFLV